MRCHSNYDGETTDTLFSCLTKDENLKNKCIRSIDRKDQQPVICINQFERTYFKKWRKCKENAINKLFKTCLSSWENNIQNPALQLEDQQGNRFSRKMNLLILLQNDTVNDLNNITKKDCPAGCIFTRYNGHIVMRRQITNEVHKPGFIECI